jgi:hypothetical protein
MPLGTILSLSNYVVALVLSIIIEVSIAYVMGYRQKKYLLTIMMINFITNPILNYFLLVLSFMKFNINLLLLGFLEIGVILVEWGLLVYTFHKPQDRLFLLSFITNTVSSLVGIMIFWI